MRIVDRSVVNAPSCLKQLTVWVKDRREIQFAIDQLNAHRAPWQLKRDGACVAVFVPGPNDHDSLDGSRRHGRNRRRR